jgi:hypothetical protein
MNRHESIRAIVFAGEKLPQLKLLQVPEKTRICFNYEQPCYCSLILIGGVFCRFLQVGELENSTLQLLERSQQRAQV